LIGSDGWRGDETLDPAWHVFSELVSGDDGRLCRRSQAKRDSDA
jgi:hypothetical protein